MIGVAITYVPYGESPPPVPARPAPTPAWDGWSEADLLIVGCDYRAIAVGQCGCKAQDYCAQAMGSGPDPYTVSLADCRRCVTGAARPARGCCGS